LPLPDPLPARHRCARASAAIAAADTGQPPADGFASPRTQRCSDPQNAPHSRPIPTSSLVHRACGARADGVRRSPAARPPLARRRIRRRRRRSCDAALAARRQALGPPPGCFGHSGTVCGIAKREDWRLLAAVWWGQRAAAVE